MTFVTFICSKNVNDQPLKRLACNCALPQFYG